MAYEYAPSIRKPTWPSEIRPANPVSTVRPSTPIRVNRMMVTCESAKLPSRKGAAISATIRTATHAFTTGESVRTTSPL